MPTNSDKQVDLLTQISQQLCCIITPETMTDNIYTTDGEITEDRTVLTGDNLLTIDSGTNASGVTFEGTGAKVATFNGDIDVTGTIDPDGLVFSANGNFVDATTASAYFTGKGLVFNETFWLNPADGAVYRGNDILEHGANLFLSDTLVSPAIPQRPTTAEISTAAGGNMNRAAYYTGSDISTDLPIFTYHIDNTGDVLITGEPALVSLNDIVQEGSIQSSTGLAVTTAIDYDTVVTDVGKYQIIISYAWTHDSTQNDIIVDFLINDSPPYTAAHLQREEPKDSSTVKFKSTVLFYDKLVAGSDNIKLNLTNDSAGATSTMQDITIKLEKFAV